MKASILVIVSTLFMLDCNNNHHDITARDIDRMINDFMIWYNEYPTDTEDIDQFFDMKRNNDEFSNKISIIEQRYREGILQFSISDSIHISIYNGDTLTRHNIYTEPLDCFGTNWISLAIADYVWYYLSYPQSIRDLDMFMLNHYAVTDSTSYKLDGYDWISFSHRQFDSREFRVECKTDTIIVYRKGEEFYKEGIKDICSLSDSERLSEYPGRRILYGKDGVPTNVFWDEFIELLQSKGQPIPPEQYGKHAILNRWVSLMEYKDGHISTVCPDDILRFDPELIKDLEISIEIFLREHNLLQRAIFPLATEDIL